MSRHKRILVSCCVHRNIIVYDATIVRAEYSEVQALVLICSCIQRSRVRVPRTRVYAHTAISRFAFCLPRINLCEWNTTEKQVCVSRGSRGIFNIRRRSRVSAFAPPLRTSIESTPLLRPLRRSRRTLIYVYHDITVTTTVVALSPLSLYGSPCFYL